MNDVVGQVVGNFWQRRFGSGSSPLKLGSVGVRLLGSGALPVAKSGSKERVCVVADRAERPLKEWRGGAKLHQR